MRSEPGVRVTRALANKIVSWALLSLSALVLSACGSDTSGSADSAETSDTSPATTSSEASASEPPAPEPSGILSTNPVPCTKLPAPAGFQRAFAAPPVMCAFESDDARVTVTVGAGPRSFEQLRIFEEDAARSNGVTPPALKEVAVEGWTFAVNWPELAGFNRMERYLVDSTGNVLICRVGVQGGAVDSTHADFCEGARALLYAS